MNSSIVDSLAEDRLLLSITDKDSVADRTGIYYVLMESELVRLSAAGRIDIKDGRVVVRDQATVGDAELDADLTVL
jgi:hypothetical protein